MSSNMQNLHSPGNTYHGLMLHFMHPHNLHFRNVRYFFIIGVLKRLLHHNGASQKRCSTQTTGCYFLPITASSKHSIAIAKTKAT